jgi:hypothetical protein
LRLTSFPVGDSGKGGDQSTDTSLILMPLT